MFASFLLVFLSVGGEYCDYIWQRCYQGPQLFGNFMPEMLGPDEPYIDGYLNQQIITEFFFLDDTACFTYDCEYEEPLSFACGHASGPPDLPYQCYSAYESHHYPVRFFDIDGDDDIDLLDFARLQSLSQDLDAWP